MLQAVIKTAKNHQKWPKMSQKWSKSDKNWCFLILVLADYQIFNRHENDILIYKNDIIMSNFKLQILFLIQIFNFLNILS
mgnify:CR=1 FL=1